MLIYSQMVKLLHILKVYCEIKGYHHMVLSGTQFTCFNGTNVQILMLMSTIIWFSQVRRLPLYDSLFKRMCFMCT